MTVHYEVKDRVAEILIEGIGEYNLFSPDEVYRPLVDAFERFRDDPEVWCALVSAPPGQTGVHVRRPHPLGQ